MLAPYHWRFLLSVDFNITENAKSIKRERRFSGAWASNGDPVPEIHSETQIFLERNKTTKIV
jgi:hypothetical protein